MVVGYVLIRVPKIPTESRLSVLPEQLASPASGGPRSLWKKNNNKKRKVEKTRGAESYAHATQCTVEGREGGQGCPGSNPSWVTQRYDFLQVNLIFLF